MSRDFPRVVRLYGVAVGDVVRLGRDASSPANPMIAWEVFPEVHVKCPDRPSMEALLERFGDGVVSIDGQPFEAVVVASLAAAGRTLATAESCTGGLIATLVTDVAGSSTVFRGGFVAYSNEVKERVLGVPADVLEDHGAVSGPTVEAMARAARTRMGADIGVAVSGVAGPAGGTPGKPVGTVWIAWDDRGSVESSVRVFEGGRDKVRRAAAFEALDGVRRRCR
jgi:PncC family amidohydrolase